MASNLGRWLKYAKAKLDDTVGSANDELDELEAERAAAVADKPWLTSDGDAPTLDEVRAKIEARTGTAGSAGAPTMPTVTTTPDGEPVTPSSWDPIPAPDAHADAADASADRPIEPPSDHLGEVPGSAPTPATITPAGDPLRSVAEAAEQSQAKLELEARAREAAERLDQIRRELGVDAPPDPKA